VFAIKFGTVLANVLLCVKIRIFMTFYSELKGGDLIIILISLHGVAQVFAQNFKGERVELPDGATVRTLLNLIKLDPSIVGVYQINKDKVVTIEYTLHQGDYIDIYPLFGGG